MKTSTLLALFALAASASGAFATTYEFSYQFADAGEGYPANPGTVTGSFSGMGPITNITDISDIKMSFNGSAMGGTFYAWSYNAPANVDGFPGNFTPGTAVVSSDPSKNDFLFTNAQSQSDAPGNYFYIIQPWNNPGPGSTTIAAQLSNDGAVSDAYNGQYVAANWSVAAVPETSTWAMLVLGFAGIGFAGFRRGRAFGVV